MTDLYIYKPRGPYGVPFDESRCKSSVRSGFRTCSRQCRRKPWKDGWCKQHHPDTVKERREQQMKDWQWKQENTPSRRAQRRYEGMCEKYNTLIGLLSNAQNDEAMEAVRRIVEKGKK